MLTQLRIQNFAIIDDVNIEFSEGMTVLTGETGSGKSILIDAIGLLFGERATSNMIRHGEIRAKIEGLVHYNNIEIDEFLKNIGIEDCDNELIITREISNNGKNICRINGQLTTVSHLKTISQLIIDIHIQNDTHRLINKNTYLNILDNLSDNELIEVKENYVVEYRKYQKLVNEYKHLLTSSNELNEKADFYRFQINEIKNANLSLEEFDSLNDKMIKVKNYDKIFGSLKQAYNFLSEGNLVDNIYNSSQKLFKIADVDENYEKLATNLESQYYQIDEIANNIKDIINSFDYNPNEINQIQERLNTYSSLMRKYKLELDELLQYYQKIEREIDNFENQDKKISQYQRDIKLQYEKLLNCANDITKSRKSIANNLQMQLKEHFIDLKLPNTNFVFKFNNINEEDDIFNSSRFTINGQDDVDIMISTNVGEPLKTLSDVASGGELSRVMLSLKVIISKHFGLSTIIFDEIDTGTSGVVANAIAKKMRVISENMQVLAISHLPQIAAKADNHYKIFKTIEDNRTTTKVIKLSEQERIEEIAKMLSTDEITEFALSNAKQLLKGV